MGLISGHGCEGLGLKARVQANPRHSPSFACLFWLVIQTLDAALTPPRAKAARLTGCVISPPADTIPMSKHMLE